LLIDHREGTLKIGDRVLAINGINVSGATLQDAHNLMRQCRGTTLFLIEYDVAIVGKDLNLFYILLKYFLHIYR
jgi:C-terminal processing protease CtpA/Prc